MRASLFLISLFPISLGLSSAGCSDGREYAEKTGVAASATAQADAPTPAANPPEAVAFEDNAERDGGNREFAYSWPAAVSAIPALAARFEKERATELAEQKAEWEESLTESPEGCVSCRGRGLEKAWQVVADLPDYLSLSATLYLYTGGAHGMHGMTSLVWDKRAGEGITGAEMFNSTVELEHALGGKLCDALDRERAKRRGAPVVRDGQWSSDCPGLDEASVLVGSSNGKTFDRIGIYFGPYVAGSYAEGDYELDFPVTASVIDAVKPAYREAFSVKR